MSSKIFIEFNVPLLANFYLLAEFALSAMRIFPSIVLLTLFLSPFLLAEENVAAPAKPEIKKLNDHEFQIGKVRLNKKTREITFGAGINLVDRPLEYLLVNGKGKVHEALCITDISPFHLNIAMKLLGFKESKELFEIVDEEYRPTGQFFKVPDEIKKAARLDLFIEWKQGDKIIRKLINELIYNPVTEKTMQPGPWLYTGSYMHNGQFKAEVAGDLFAIHPRQPPLVSYPGKDHAGENAWLTDPKVTPEEGTVVKFTLKPHKSK